MDRCQCKMCGKFIKEDHYLCPEHTKLWIEHFQQRWVNEWLDDMESEDTQTEIYLVDTGLDGYTPIDSIYGI